MPRLKSASLWNSSETCTASSRVGQRMSTCTAFRFGSVFSMAGMANAAVLPEPVCDWPTTSRPLMSTGMASAWIGAAFSKPSLSMAFRISAERPSSENNFGGHAMSFDFCSVAGFGAKGELIRQNVSFAYDVASVLASRGSQRFEPISARGDARPPNFQRADFSA